MKLRNYFFSAAFLALAGTMSAQELTDYGVYRIDQAYTGYNNGARSMASWGIGGISLPGSDSSDEAQMWVAVPDEDHTGWYFRSYSKGHYMTSPKATSQQWYTTLSDKLDQSRSFMRVEARDANGGDYLIYPASIEGTSDFRPIAGMPMPAVKRG